MAILKSIMQKLKNGNQKDNCQSKTVSAKESEMNMFHNETVDHDGRYLVVASQDSTFADSAVEYAIDMAKRMDYHLIALNAVHMEHPIVNALSTADQACKDFIKAAEKNVNDFRKKAEKKGLELTHVVNFNTVDKAIKEIEMEFKNIEFVVSTHAEEDFNYERPVNENRIEQRLCVYAMS